MSDLTHYTALVTGANSDIGQSIALGLAKNGAWVIGTSTSEKGAHNFSKLLQNNHLKGMGMLLNLSCLDSINRLYDSLKKINRLPHLLINHAGIKEDHLAIRLTPKDWDTVFDVNTKGTFHLTKKCLPFMLKENYGRIIYTSSVIAFTGNIGQANYAASKAALAGLTKSLALEVASRNITVNIIAPGLITSKMTSQLTHKQYATLLEKIPMKRPGKPEDVAHACLFLASQASSYITGHTLHVNGGLWME